MARSDDGMDASASVSAELRQLRQIHVPLAAGLDPLEAYRRLRAAGLRPLLLLSAGPHPEARRSFIGLTPLAEVRVQPDSVEERWADGSIEVVPLSSRAIPGQLQTLFDRYRFHLPATDGHEGFTGGWMGVFTFAFARTLEPTLPPGPSPTVPDAQLRLCLDALSFDAGTGACMLHAADLDAPGVAEAKDRVEAIRLALAEPGPLLQSPPSPGSLPSRWEPSFAQAGFEDAVARIRDLVQDGDLFQANIALRWRTRATADPLDVLAALRAANPSPYMALLEWDDWQLVSGSPEQLFAVEAGRIRSRPIAGTRKRGKDTAEDSAMERELRSDPKEQAEHTMLVDLVRNDLARVAVAGSVCVPERMGVERYRHVMHLVSRVEASVRPGTAFMDWLGALFPGGTVTGAPKVRATQRILECEPVARGAYTGSAGYLGWDHRAHWSILIRGMQAQGGNLDVHAGAGIVADSDPGREWKESGRKAQALLEAASPGAPRPERPAFSGNPTRLGDSVPGERWDPPRVARRFEGARVLLVDNYDSFVHNLADYCAALGSKVQVVRNDADWRVAFRMLRPTHAILSPGPGWPQDAGCSLEVARELGEKVPLLGVCLGHQALGLLAGATVKVHPKGPVHGKTDRIHHHGAGLFAGLPSPLVATRYHSLVVQDVPAGWSVDARLADGTVMALRKESAPTFGLQFHPESIATQQGMDLLANFLAQGLPGLPLAGGLTEMKAEPL